MHSEDLTYCQELGRRLVETWRSARFDVEALPALAVEVLTREQPWRHLDPERVIQWLARTPGVPYQPDVTSNFGEPSVTLFWHPLCRIDLLYWATGTTAIHEHSFAGAFTLMTGSSVQSTYRFELEERVNERLLLGDLRLEECRLLSRGVIEPIRPGSELIHSVFHLDAPSVSLVLRTNMVARSAPQYMYMPPHVALDTFFIDQTLRKKMGAFRLLRTVRPDLFEATLFEAIQEADLQTCFELMHFTFTHQPDPALWNRLRDVLRGRFGRWPDAFVRVFLAADRTRLIVAARERVRSPEQRFFLALLLNVPDRDALLALVADRYPDAEAVSQVAHWIVALGRAGVLDVPLPPVEPPLVRTVLHASADAPPPPQNTDDEPNLDPRTVVQLVTALRQSRILQPLFNRATTEVRRELSLAARHA
jgi:hypothetical protein